MKNCDAYTTIDELCVNTLRFLSTDAIENAGSGHPGMPLGAAPMAYVLWTRFLKYHPENPYWFDRDRFVLSAGHGSALLYSLLHMCGYDVSINDLKHFRQWNSNTPGHPERSLTSGVEISTGPLGQGFGNSVGMAIAEKNLAARFNRHDMNVIDHFTYVLVSDGDMMEGVVSEAASLAGHLQLGKLICLYDDNHVTLSAGTDMSFTESHAQRFDAYGWQTISVDDGNDLAAIERALHAARAEAHRPSLILIRTHLGYGAPHKQDTCAAHGAPLGQEELRLTKQCLDWPDLPMFGVPAGVHAHFLVFSGKGAHAEVLWNKTIVEYGKEFPDLARELRLLMQNGPDSLGAGWDQDMPAFEADCADMSTRAASGAVLNALAKRNPALIGGSADLDQSTCSQLQGMGDFQPIPGVSTDLQGSDAGGWSYRGRNIHFGVREHAMGSMMNGMAVHGGAVPFGATFLVFSDYMRPPIRLAAMMGLHVIYIFTHDSIAVGEDGPTHQPVEQLACLRAIPGLVVLRPADATETTEAWLVAMQSFSRPVAIVLTRQPVAKLARDALALQCGVRHGAYILAEAVIGMPEIILIATGSEVSLAIRARQQLLEYGVQARVVSMPSWELFEEQPSEYRENVLPANVKCRISVEAGVGLGWCRYVGNEGAIISVDFFGISASADVVLREYGLTSQHIFRRALALLGR